MRMINVECSRLKKFTFDPVQQITLEQKRSLYYYRPESTAMFRVSVKHSRKGVVEAAHTLLARLDPQLSWRIMDTKQTHLEKFMSSLGICPYTEISCSFARDVSHNPRTTCKKEYVASVENITVGQIEDSSISETILVFDIECANLKRFNHMPQAAFHPVFQISSYFGPYNGEAEGIVFCVKRTESVPGAEIRHFPSEKGMLAAFCRYVSEQNPDCINGFNSNNFDFPYLYIRCDIWGISDLFHQSFSRVKGHPLVIRQIKSFTAQKGCRASLTITCPGRLILDTLEVVKMQNHKLDSFTLNHLAGVFLKESKQDDIAYRDIPRIFLEGDPAELARCARYCLKDSRLTLDILIRIRGYEFVNEMSRIVFMERNALVTGGQQRKCFSALCAYIARRGLDLLVPDRIREAEHKKYKGATVISPVVGYHTEPLAVLDYCSLYPSVIVAHNLCYTTLMEGEPPSHWKRDEDFYYNEETEAYFVSKKHKKSLLAGVIEEFLQKRATIKRDMKIADPLGILNCRQLALKMISNSFYGQCGAGRNGIIPCLKIASTITSCGREMLRRTVAYIEETYTVQRGYPCDVKCKYGDTDSLFLSMNNQTDSQAAELGNDIADEVTTRLYVKPIQLEFEKVFSSLILYKAKNYVGVVDGQSLDMKGIKTVKRNTPFFIRKLFNALLKVVLVEKDLQKAENLFLRVIDVLKKDGGKCQIVTPDNFVHSVALRKDPDDYVTVTPQVHLTKRMRRNQDPDAGRIGDYIPMVVCEDGIDVSSKVQHPKHAGSRYPVDVQYYIDYMVNTFQSYLGLCFQSSAVLNTVKRHAAVSRVCRGKLRPSRNTRITDFFQTPPKQFPLMVGDIVTFTDSGKRLLRD